MLVLVPKVSMKPCPIVHATIATTKVMRCHRRKRARRCGKWAVKLGDALQSFGPLLCMFLNPSRSPSALRVSA